MPDVNVKFLRTFLTLIEERNYAKTAARLGVPQSRVRDHISALERATDKRLLERGFPTNPASGGRTQLTEEGRLLWPKAIKTVRAHDSLFDDRPEGLDPYDQDRIMALALLEKALATLNHDLTTEDRDRIDALLR